MSETDSSKSKWGKSPLLEYQLPALRELNEIIRKLEPWTKVAERATHTPDVKWFTLKENP